MKKFLLLLLLLTSCATLKKIYGPQPEYINKWCGTVLIVNVFYEFNENGTYLEGTFAVNNVQVGGTRGLWKAESEDIVKLHQLDEYEFDNDTLKGQGVRRPKIYDIGVKVADGKIYIDIDPNGDTVMYLSRCEEEEI